MSRESFYIPPSPAPSFDLMEESRGHKDSPDLSLLQQYSCPWEQRPTRWVSSTPFTSQKTRWPLLEADLELQVSLTHPPPYSTLHPPNLVNPILQTYAMGFRPPEVTLLRPLLCSTLISRIPKNHLRNRLVFKPVVPKEE